MMTRTGINAPRPMGVLTIKAMMMTSEEIAKKYENNPGMIYCFECGREMTVEQKDRTCEILGEPLCGFCMAIYLTGRDR